jgi:hypothetical protein
MTIAAAMLMASTTGAASEPQPAHFLCSEPARGGHGDPIFYHLTFQEGGWFRTARLIWEERGIGLEMRASSGDLVVGEAASTDYMPDRGQIDLCFSEELAQHPTHDLDGVRHRCQARAALSRDRVPIKLVISIDRASGVFTVTREQSKRITRYNTEDRGYCRRQ